MYPPLKGEQTALVPNADLPKAENDIESITTFPEGGRRAYSTVFGGFLVTFCTFGLSQVFGVFQDFYTRVSLSEHTPSQISWIGSVQLFFFFGLSLVAGKLLSDGYFHQMLIFGSVLYVFSYFMLSLAEPHQYYQVILSQGVCSGIGLAFLYLPSLAVVAAYFQRKRSTMMGIVSAGSALGGVLHPIMLNHLFYNPKTKFAWGVRASALLILGLLIIANLVMRTHFPENLNGTGKAKKPDLRVIFTDVPYLIAVAGSFLAYWGMFFPLFYLQLFAILHGIDPNFAFYSITVLNGASFFGRIIPNFFGDKYGAINVLILMTFLSGGLVFAMTKATTERGLILFAIFYGFCSGSVFSLGAPSAASYTNSLEEVGLYSGFVLSAVSIALLTGNPIAGALVQAPHYYWNRSIIFSGVIILVGACLITVSRVKLGAKRDTWRL